MRIRKNGLGVSPIVFPEDSHFNPGQEVQTRYCKLNQSPWDVITDFSPPSSPMAPPHSNPFEVEEEHAFAVFNDPISKQSVDPEKKTTEEYCNNDLTIKEDQEEHGFAVNKDLIPKPSVDPQEQTTEEYYNNDLTIEEVDQKLPNLPAMKENFLTPNVQPHHELTVGGYQIPKSPPTDSLQAARDLLRRMNDREAATAASSSLLSSPSLDFRRFGGFGQRSGRKRKAYEMSDAGKPKP